MKRAMREGEFQSAGKTVSYTDADTLQLASDLYQLVDHDYKGSPGIDATRLEEIIKHIHAGMPLGEAEWDILSDIEKRYGTELVEWRARGRDGQDPEVPSGSGRIQEAASDLLALGLQRIGEKSSPSAPIELDRQITHAHLLDGALHDLAHSKLHAERLADPKVRKDPKSVEFHYDHVIKHVDGGIDHMKRLRAQLAKHPSDPDTFRKEFPRLHKIREAEPEPEAPISVQMEPRKSAICVDFDGVIHEGPHGLPGRVEGELVKGAAAGLKNLSQRFRVIILTARVDLDAVRDWLKAQKVDQYVDEVTNRKPPASAYIDDRATHFTDWSTTLKAVDPDVPVVEVPKPGTKVYHTDAGLRVKVKETEKSPIQVVRESSPFPPPNLRMAPAHDEAAEATSNKPVHECGTCKMFWVERGICQSYVDARGRNIAVGEDWLCDSWYLAPEWKQQDVQADAEAAALLSDIFGL